MNLEVLTTCINNEADRTFCNHLSNYSSIKAKELYLLLFSATL